MGLAMVCKKLAVLCSATTEPFLRLSVSLMFYGLPEDRQTSIPPAVQRRQLPKRSSLRQTTWCGSS